MRYTLGWNINVVLVVLAVLEGIFAAIKGFAPADLGISPILVNWLMVVNAGCVVLAALLPQLTKTPQEHANQQAALGRKRASDH